MNILILNSILYTADNNKIPKVESIKDTMIYNMCLGFVQLGNNVTLAAANEYKPINIEKYDFEILFFKSKMTKIFQPSVLPFSSALYHYIKYNYHKFDLIISSEIFSFQSLFASIICKSKTVIWHELAMHPHKYKKIPSKIWYNIIVPLFMKKTFVIPRSKNAMNFISQYKKNISNHIVEHGINLDQFKYERIKKNQFIVVSQLIKRKNIFSIIDKFIVFNDDSYKLLIVGKGELEYDLKRYIHCRNKDNKILLVGYQSHCKLNALLANSKAMLIDTWQDNNMVSIPESIVCGTPIVSNDIPTNSDFISENRLGIVKKKWGANDLRQIIKENDIYINNCINYRSRLSNSYSARNIINIFQNENITFK
jgi:1,2-diacylglycerol 3-alpha-glucosyltransferase